MFRQFRVSKQRRMIKPISCLVTFTMLCQIAMVPQALAREIARSHNQRLEAESARERRLGIADSMEPEIRSRAVRQAASALAREMLFNQEGLTPTEIRGDIDALIEHIQSEQIERQQNLALTRAKLAKRGVSNVILDRLLEYESMSNRNSTESLRLLRRARMTSTGLSRESAANSLLEHFETKVDVRPDPKHFPHTRQRQPRKAIGMAPVFEYPWALADLNSMSVIGDLFANLGVNPAEGEPTPEDLAVAYPEIMFEVAECENPSDCMEGSDPIRCLVEELECDPIRIFEHVRNEYAYEFYFGSIKGAKRTLAEKRGNDLDLAALLISMLRSSGVHSRFVFGTIDIDVDDALAWAGVRDASQFVQLMIDAGIPVEYDQTTDIIRKDHVWVRAYMDVYPYRTGKNNGDTWVDLDPSFKRHSFSGQDIGGLFGLSASVIRSNAQIGADIEINTSHEAKRFVSGLDKSSSESQFRSLAEPIRDYLVSNHITAEEVFWQRNVAEQQFGIAPLTDMYRVHDTGVSTVAVPPILRHQIVLSIDDPQTYPAGDDRWLSYKANLAELTGEQIFVHYLADPESLSLLADPDGFDGNTTLLRLQPQLEIGGEVVSHTADNSLLAAPGEIQALIVEFRGPGERDTNGDGVVDTAYAGLNTPIITDQLMVGGVHALVIDAQTVTGDDLQRSSATLDSIVFDNSLFNITGLPKTLGQVLDSVGQVYFHQMDRYNQMIAGSLGVVISRQPSIARISWELDVPDPQLPNNVTGGDVTMRILLDSHVTALAAGSPPDSGNMNPDDQFILTSAFTSNAVEASALKQILGAPQNLDPTMDPLGDHASVVKLMSQIMEEGRSGSGDIWNVYSESHVVRDTQHFINEFGLPYNVAKYLRDASGLGTEISFSKQAFTISDSNGAIPGELKWYALIQRDLATNSVAFSLIDENGALFSSGRFMVRGQEGLISPSIYDLLTYNTNNHDLYNDLVDGASFGVANAEDAGTNAALWFLPAVSHINDIYQPYAEALSNVNVPLDYSDPVIAPLASILVSAPIDRATEEPAILNLFAQSLNDSNPQWLRLAEPGIDDDADQLRISADVTRAALWTIQVFDSSGEDVGNAISGSNGNVDVVIDADDLSLTSGVYGYEMTATYPGNETISAVPVEGSFMADLDLPSGLIDSTAAVPGAGSNYGPGVLNVYGYADDSESFGSYKIYLGGELVHTSHTPVPYPGSGQYQRLASIDTTDPAFGFSISQSFEDMRLEVFDTAGNHIESSVSSVEILNPRGLDEADPIITNVSLLSNGVEVVNGATASDGPLTLEFKVTDAWTAQDSNGALSLIEVLLDGQVVWSHSIDLASEIDDIDFTGINNAISLQINGSDLYPEMLTNNPSHQLTINAYDSTIANMPPNVGTATTSFGTDEDFTMLALDPSTATLADPFLHLTGTAEINNWSVTINGPGHSDVTLNPGTPRAQGPIDEIVDTTGLDDGMYALNFYDHDNGQLLVASLPFEVDLERYPVAMLSGLADITADSQLHEVPPLTSVLDGILALRGRAYDAAAQLGDGSNISMSLTLTSKDGSEIHFQPTADSLLWSPSTNTNAIELTSPGIGTANAVDIAKLDLSTIPDGLYDVTLKVTSGLGSTAQSASDTRPLSITSPLKVGQFKFSQQDVSVPVQGLPLSLVRTYDSQRAAIDGPFGKGWQFSLYDMDIKIDEEREPANSYFDGDLATHITCRDVESGMFNRNVSMTLPDGRRVTCAMRLNRIQMAGIWEPEYILPPGVKRFDVFNDGRTIQLISQPSLHWSTEGYTVPDSFFDFPGWDLELDDGTEFMIRRPELASNLLLDPNITGVGVGNVTALYGEPYLESIKLTSGEELRFHYTESDGSEPDAFKYIKYIESRPSADSADARKMALRYENERIVAVAIGSETTDDVIPSYMYKYDTNGQLIAVRRVRVLAEDFSIVDVSGDPDNGGPNGLIEWDELNGYPFDETTFEYDANDGIITSISDPRGLQPVVTTYREDGRVESIADAYGNLTTFDYDLENKTQTVTNPDESTVYYEYDDLGNVTLEQHSNGKSIVRTYDGVLLLSEHDESREGSTIYGYNSRDEIVRTEDPEGNVTTRDIQYQSGSPSSIVTRVVSDDPTIADIVTEQYFDLAGNLIRTVSGDTVTENEYDSSNRITKTLVTDINANGAAVGLRPQTSYGYTNGKLTSVTQHNSSDPEIDDDVTQTFVYDENDNQILSYTERENNFVGTYTVYDPAQRAVESWQYDGAIPPLATDRPTSNGNGYTKLNSTYYNGVDQVVMTIDHRSESSSTTRYDRRGDVIETAQWPIDISTNLVADIDMHDAVNWFSRVTPDTMGVQPVDFDPSEGESPVVSRTHYNELGQAELVTDQFLAPAYPDMPSINNAPYGTMTTYDDDGAVQRTYRVEHAVIDVLFEDTIDNVLTPVNIFTSSIAQDEVLGSRSETHYDQLGRVEYTISGELNNQLRTEYDYDDNDRQKSVSLLSVAHADYNFTSTYTYDTAGRRDSSTDPSGNTVRYRYDDLGRLTHTIVNDPTAGEVDTQTIYDALGRRSQTIDQLGQARTFRYDQSNRLTSVELPEVFDPGSDPLLDSDDGLISPTYNYTYDENGNLKEILDPNLALTTLEYDYLGRRVSRTLPGQKTDSNNDLTGGARTETWHYYDADTTAAGERPNQLRAHIDFNGNITYYTYDLDGRLDTKSHYTPTATLTASGPPTETAEDTYTYTYDEFGRQDTVTSLNNGATDYHYGPDGRLQSVLTPIGETVSYTHHGNGSLKSISDGTSTTEYTYDALGRLETVTANGQTWIYKYDEVGNRSMLTRPDGSKTEYVYDTLHRLTKLTNRDIFGTRLSEYQYTLRPDGRRSSVIDIRKEASGESAVRIDYTYDALNRLTSEAWSSVTGFATRSDAAYTSTISYTYDAAGNRVLKVTEGPTNSYVKYTYADDGSDRLWTETHFPGLPTPTLPDYTKKIDYRWDSNGFLIHKYTDLDGDGNTDETENYTANAEGKLTTYTKDGVTSTFTYDHTGERIKTDIGTRTITDLVTRNNPTGYSQVLTRTDNLAETYNIIGDDLLAQDVGVLNHLLYDGHGSTRLLYTSSIQERYDYDAYGNAVGFDQSMVGTSYLYTGEQADLALGDSYYLRARFYMPGPAMFTSLDPYFGSTGDPQSLHKYAYVHGDPVNAWDPSGMLSIVGTLEALGANAWLRTSVNTPLGFALYYATVVVQIMSAARTHQILDGLERSINSLRSTVRALSRESNDPSTKHKLMPYILALDEMHSELIGAIAGNIAIATISPILALSPMISLYVLAYRINDVRTTVALALSILEGFGRSYSDPTGYYGFHSEINPRSELEVMLGTYVGLFNPSNTIDHFNSILEVVLRSQRNGGQLDHSDRTILETSFDDLASDIDWLSESGFLEVKHGSTWLYRAF